VVIYGKLPVINHG